MTSSVRSQGGAWPSAYDVPTPSPGVAAPPLPLTRCALCFLVIGCRRRIMPCSFCNVALCAHCVDFLPGEKHWCGDCELPRTNSLAASSTLFPSKALSSARDGRQTHSASSSPTGSSKETNVCQLCFAAFGVFSSRRKFFCSRCRATVCNSCSKRLPSGGRPRSGIDGLLDRLKEASDARLCLHCDGSPLSR